MDEVLEANEFIPHFVPQFLMSFFMLYFIFIIHYLLSPWVDVVQYL